MIKSTAIFSLLCSFLSALLLFSLNAVQPAHALSDLYYSSGEDINMIMDNEQITVMEELEFELRRIPLFREVEDFFYNFEDDDVELFDE